MRGDSERTTVIRNGTLIDGTGDDAGPNDALVIEGNRIKSIGEMPAGLDGAEGVDVVDAAGQWILPGLIDAHVHLSYGNPKLAGEARGRGTTRPELNAIRAGWNAGKVLRAGVTSISVPGGSWFTDVGVRDAVDLGLVEGPRIACASRMIATYGSIEDEDPSWVGTPDHSLGVLCNSATEMVTEVRRQLKHGVDFVKLADSRSGDVHCISQHEMSAVVAEAHRRNARVAIHSRGSGSTRAAAEAGVDWIIHADLATEQDIDAVAEAGCRLMPTATFVEKVLEVGQSVGQDTIQINIDMDRMKRQIDGIASVLQHARALGVPVMCGTDSGNYGWMPYGELHANEAEIMVRLGGYTPMEAIVAFTRNGAYAMGLEDELGVLAQGRLADVIIVSRDPVEDIRVLKGGADLATVIKDGKVVDLKRAIEPDMLSFVDDAARRSNVA